MEKENENCKTRKNMYRRTEKGYRLKSSPTQENAMEKKTNEAWGGEEPIVSPAGRKEFPWPVTNKS